ncbi:helix-turn-helix domain-containing protein [Clostridium sp. YIM B02515]|uniref:Helix-turn-helix domain-containing protein n=1 Tax=Clostridium rhizosphaerae TaxID=2803861 RepID=A0ABS1TCC2_9CLOT|nr:helix-turn-helix domain-containing protein [Clostridium rhizosphaerae]MBL4936276.1 helix-turn-helix domain-containing protein [Clostridium rhizosphaerae]
MKYNSHGKLKPSGSVEKAIMTKGHITTFEERIEIVKYCIESDRNYNEIAEKYKVSYQQVRSWTVKYTEFGIDALLDRGENEKPKASLQS